MLKPVRIVSVTIASLMVFTAARAADMKDTHETTGMNMSKTAMEQAQGVGVIKAVDLQRGAVTIAHEPIKSFEWPAMTMKFKVADPAMLKNVAVGNKVKFTLQGKDMMKSTVTKLEMAD